MLPSNQARTWRLLLWLLPALGVLTSMNRAIAFPVQTAQRQSFPAPMDQFYNYLNQQKYTLLLGESRGACAYHIDPTDLYQQGTSRFVTAKISRGDSGTACRGVLEFQILQADCQTNTLYEFVRESEGDPRLRGWKRFEISLSNPTQSATQAVTQQPAMRICSLPAKSNGEQNSR